MPIASYPPIPPRVIRSVTIQLKGPKDTAVIKQFNRALEKIAKKYGATFKKQPKASKKRPKAKRK
ncbi:MAG TPA: hypothetical protein VEL75_09950 [Candidatus Methylomirabilis sp.]|nr:hypothetical protein [Candidatus Methylomirabilis sp.]